MSPLGISVLSVRLCRILDCGLTDVFNGTAAGVGIFKWATVKSFPALHYSVVIYFGPPWTNCLARFARWGHEMSFGSGLTLFTGWGSFPLLFLLVWCRLWTCLVSGLHSGPFRGQGLSIDQGAK